MVGKVVLLLMFRLAGLSSNFCLTFLCAAAEKEKNRFTGLGLPSTLHKRGKIQTSVPITKLLLIYIFKSKYKKVGVLPIRRIRIVKSNVSSIGPSSAERNSLRLFLFLSDKWPTLETLDFTNRIGSTTTFYISICISTLPTQHTAFILLLIYILYITYATCTSFSHIERMLKLRYIIKAEFRTWPGPVTMHI